MNNGCDALIAIYCLEYCNCGQYIFLCRCNGFFKTVVYYDRRCRSCRLDRCLAGDFIDRCCNNSSGFDICPTSLWDHQYLLRMQLENSNWDQAFDLRQSILWTVMIATVFTKITTYCTDQTIVQRYLTTKTVKEARKSVYLNATMTVLVTVQFFLVGTAICGNLRHYCQYHCANISY